MVKQGDVVHYSGDMANRQGWFMVRAVLSPMQIQLVEVSGGENREFTVAEWNIGNVYAGHCDPRFVTFAAFNAWREALGRCPVAREAIVAATEEVRS